MWPPELEQKSHEDQLETDVRFTRHDLYQSTGRALTYVTSNVTRSQHIETNLSTRKAKYALAMCPLPEQAYTDS